MVFLNTWQITFGKKHKLTNFITHVFGLYVLEPVHNLFNNKAMKARLVCPLEVQAGLKVRTQLIQSLPALVEHMV